MNWFFGKRKLEFKEPEIVIAKVGDVVIINGVPYRVESERLRQMIVEPYYRSTMSEAQQEETEDLRKQSKGVK